MVKALAAQAASISGVLAILLKLWLGAIPGKCLAYVALLLSPAAAMVAAGGGMAAAATSSRSGRHGQHGAQASEIGGMA